MIPIEIKNRIQQLNPWITTPDKATELITRFIPKNYIKRYTEQTLIRNNCAMLIVGPRQAGKSTMVWHQLKPFSPDILFLNMEDHLLRSGLNDSIDFIEHLQETYSFVKAIFIDEIQHMDEAGLFIKGIIDARLDIPIWATGSSAFDLRSKTRESLAGRATRKRLLPFSISELIAHENPPNPLAEKHVCEKIISHQLVYGSYPAVWISQNHEEKVMHLIDLTEALILRDASDLFKIKRVDAFRRLLTLLSGQIGNLVNLSELASSCNVNVGTIISYIEILEQSHIVKSIRPFAEGKRREITGTPKVFFIDNGIRNQLLNNFSKDLDLRTDKGQLLENWVFTEIYRALPFQSSVKFWRSKAKAEVDFVIEHANKIYGLEVKFTDFKQSKISRSARSFLEVYKPEKFAVLNMGLQENIEVDEIMVEFIFPMDLNKWLSTIFSASNRS
ncbi:ATP-binding protein [Desulfobacterales bacterium HSG17]|nr:ATP-binding protein [Desulfobacterales bacterium HSG17]